jgi:tetratricopeptide (TPR) repeat protein
MNRSWQTIGLILTLLWVLTAVAQDTPPQPEELPYSGDLMSSGLSDDEKIVEINRLLTLNPRNSDLYNNLGVIYAGREDWDKARDSFIAAVQSDPRMPDYHRNLGMVFSQLSLPEMAVSEYETYRNLAGPAGLDAWRMIGDVWRKAENVPMALQAYQQCIKSFDGDYNPETAQSVMAQVMMLEQTGDTAAMEGLLEQWVEPAAAHLAMVGDAGEDQQYRASKAITTKLLLIKMDNAKLMAESGMHAEAAALYESAMTIDPSRDDLLPQIATEWLASGDQMKAKVIAQRAISDFPEKAAGWRAMGRIADAEDRHRDAIEAYTKAWNIDPSRSDLAARIGMLYMTIGDNKNARQFMGPVVSDPDTPIEMIFNYALSLQRERDFALSVAPLRKVVEREPDFFPGWQALATALRVDKKYSAAAKAYARCQALEPAAKNAFQQGFCLTKVDRYDEAVTAYEQAVELDPTYEKARYNLGLAVMKTEDYEYALEVFQQALEFEPDSYRLYFNMGLCHFNLRDDDQAIEYYDLAMEQKETSAVWTNMGMAFDRMGEKAEANNCFKTAKALKAEGR